MASRGPQRPGGRSEAGERERSPDVRLLLAAEHDDPFSFLGMHPRPDGALGVRVFRPDARAVTVRAPDGARFESRRIHAEGLFEAEIAGRDPFPYELEITGGGGEVAVERDPYSFPLLTGDRDRYLFNEGTHLQADGFLGAHQRTLCGCGGVAFALWAPAASRVSVVGDFNGWDGRRHPMRHRGVSGIWELFVPHLGAGAVYKYEIRTADGDVLLKADPCAFRTEAPPATASVVCDVTAFEWSDADWMSRRGERDWLREPLAIYEVHLGSWRGGEKGRTLGYRELAQELVEYVAGLGYTHLELMPVAEHPFGGSWGYQVSGYFAPTARYGEPADFAWFVDLCHRRGIGVIIDWVPGHFPDDGHGLARFDGTHLYEHADPRLGRHPDWGTSIFNFGRREVVSFLVSNARFWFDRYHVDGLRVDAVSSMLYRDYSRREGEWVPNAEGGRENLEAIDFIRRMNGAIQERFPGALIIAEESTSWPGVSRPPAEGGLGFGYKWNMGWMNDVLRYMSRDPAERRCHQSDLTFGMLYACSENFVLPLSHDEVVHGKGSLLGRMPGSDWERFANLRLLLAFMYGHPGKKLLFMGGEFGQWSEWDCDRVLDWHLLEHAPHRGIQRLAGDLNALYRESPSLHRLDADPCGFQWIDCRDADNSVLSFRRRSDEAADGELLFAFNFSAATRRDYRLGLPLPGRYEELLNTDAGVYWGSGAGNPGGLEAIPHPWHGLDWSAPVTLPPLAAVVFRRTPA